MTVTGSDNITLIGKNPLPCQKINRTCGFETIPDDKLKIEIPNKKISATYNTVNKVNKLVTVFASELTEEPF
jgi:hypothetical protein